MIRVAVTGGIGSGKTVVCKVFEILGVPVFYADSEAKKLINNSPVIKEKLISLFGNDIYQPNGDIHRKKLADLIFNNEIALRKINSIVHPEVRKAFSEWANNQTFPYVIQEAAIVFESGQSDSYEMLITVTAPSEVKIQRVMERDNVSRDKVLERMNNQLSDDYKIEKSDFVIVNDNIEMVIPQIIKIHNKLIS